MKLLTTLIQIALYLVCYYFIAIAFKHFACYVIYSQFGTEAKAIIKDTKTKKIGNMLRSTHHYEYRIGDGILREGKLTKYNSDFNVDDEIEINYVKEYPDLSHYPQPNQEIIYTLTYSIVGLIMLYRVSVSF